MKIIEVVTTPGHIDTVTSIAEQHGALDHWIIRLDVENERQAVRLLVSDNRRQGMLDALQHALGTSPQFRLVVMPIEATLPRQAEDTQEPKEKGRGASATREELYQNVVKSAVLDSNFLLLVSLSTFVAAIGLLEDNVAVVIGAMLIAPLLGPNIALALATALGDAKLMWQSLKTNLAGLGLAFALSLLIGLLWSPNIESQELLARTVVGFDSIALALASGAAAVLSLTTGLSSVLVGVMVAVALLPPTATFGLMLGSGQLGLAFGALLLLVANIVSVNLAAKLVFLYRGVRPRTWYERQKARESMKTYIIFWVASLFILVVAIYLRAQFAP